MIPPKVNGPKQVGLVQITITPEAKQKIMDAMEAVKNGKMSVEDFTELLKNNNIHPLNNNGVISFNLDGKFYEIDTNAIPKEKTADEKINDLIQQLLNDPDGDVTDIINKLTELGCTVQFNINGTFKLVSPDGTEINIVTNSTVETEAPETNTISKKEYDEHLETCIEIWIDDFITGFARYGLKTPPRENELEYFKDALIRSCKGENFNNFIKNNSPSLDEVYDWVGENSRQIGGKLAASRSSNTQAPTEEEITTVLKTLEKQFKKWHSIEMINTTLSYLGKGYSALDTGFSIEISKPDGSTYTFMYAEQTEETYEKMIKTHTETWVNDFKNNWKNYGFDSAPTAAEVTEFKNKLTTALENKANEYANNKANEETVYNEIGDLSRNIAKEILAKRNEAATESPETTETTTTTTETVTNTLTAEELLFEIDNLIQQFNDKTITLEELQKKLDDLGVDWYMNDHGDMQIKLPNGREQIVLVETKSIDEQLAEYEGLINKYIDVWVNDFTSGYTRWLGADAAKPTAEEIQFFKDSLTAACKNGASALLMQKADEEGVKNWVREKAEPIRQQILEQRQSVDETTETTDDTTTRLSSEEIYKECLELCSLLAEGNITMAEVKAKLDEMGVPYTENGVGGIIAKMDGWPASILFGPMNYGTDSTGSIADLTGNNLNAVTVDFDNIKKPQSYYNNKWLSDDDEYDKYAARDEAVKYLEDNFKDQFKTEITKQLAKLGIDFKTIENLFNNIFLQASWDAAEELVKGNDKWYDNWSGVSAKTLTDNFVNKFNQQMQDAIKSMNKSTTDMDLQDIDLTGGGIIDKEVVRGMGSHNNETGWSWDSVKNYLVKLGEQLKSKAEQMCKANGIEFNEATFKIILGNATAKATADINPNSFDISKMVETFLNSFEESYTKHVNKTLKGNDEFKADLNTLDYSGIIGYYGISKITYKSQGDMINALYSELNTQLYNQMLAKLESTGIPQDVFKNIYDNVFAEVLADASKDYTSLDLDKVVEEMLNNFNTKINKAVNEYKSAQENNDLYFGDLDFLDILKVSEYTNGRIPLTEVAIGGSIVMEGNKYENFVNNLKEQVLQKAKDFCKNNGIEFDEAAFELKWKNAISVAEGKYANISSIGADVKVKDFLKEVLTDFKKKYPTYVKNNPTNTRGGELVNDLSGLSSNSGIQINTSDLAYYAIDGYNNNGVYKKAGNSVNKDGKFNPNAIDKDAVDWLNKQLKNKFKDQIKQQVEALGIDFKAFENIFNNIFDSTAWDVVLNGGVIKENNKAWGYKDSISFNKKDIVDKFVTEFNKNIKAAINDTAKSDKDMDFYDMDYSKAFDDETLARNTSMPTLMVKMSIESLKDQIEAKAKAMCEANGVKFDQEVFDARYNNTLNELVAGKNYVNAGDVLKDFLVNFESSWTTWVNKQK